MCMGICECRTNPQHVEWIVHTTGVVQAGLDVTSSYQSSTLTHSVRLHMQHALPTSFHCHSIHSLLLSAIAVIAASVDHLSICCYSPNKFTMFIWSANAWVLRMMTRCSKTQTWNMFTCCFSALNERPNYCDPKIHTSYKPYFIEQKFVYSYQIFSSPSRTGLLYATYTFRASNLIHRISQLWYQQSIWFSGIIRVWFQSTARTKNGPAKKSLHSKDKGLNEAEKERTKDYNFFFIIWTMWRAVHANKYFLIIPRSWTVWTNFFFFWLQYRICNEVAFT